ncbi:hypothetical protein [Xenorhabdus bovienii]
MFVLPTVYTLLARNYSAVAVTLRKQQLIEVDEVMNNTIQRHLSENK